MNNTALPSGVLRTDAPLRLKSARAWRTYTGGRLIDEMQGLSPARDTHFPEDWIMSVVRAGNPGREEIVEGLNELAEEGQGTLRDLIAADPVSALGAAHVERWGATPAVLVKIIDAAERLAVQVHPDTDHAARYFGSPFGKTECWHILGVRSPDACVHLGFKPGVTREKWEEAAANGTLLHLLHRFPAHPGDTFLVKAGVPHAIGAGCLLVEIQEPTDFTLRAERMTPQGYRMEDRQMHGGIGFEAMFDCFSYDGLEEEEARRRWCPAPRLLEDTPGFTRRELVGRADTPCFALERLDIRGECRIDPSGRFCGLYATSGRGVLRSVSGEEPVSPGTQFFVPAASKPFTIKADPSAPLTLFRALPPA